MQTMKACRGCTGTAALPRILVIVWRWLVGQLLTLAALPAVSIWDYV